MENQENTFELLTEDEKKALRKAEIKRRKTDATKRTYTVKEGDPNKVNNTHSGAWLEFLD